MVERIRIPDRELIKRLVELEGRAFGSGGLNEWMLVPIIRHGLVYCIRVNEEIAGVAEYMRDWEHPSTAYLVGISIEEGRRGEGLGTVLLHDSIKELKSQGVVKVELTVAPENHAAIAVYQRKLGFEVLELRKNEYGMGEDRLVMQLGFINE